MNKFKFELGEILKDVITGFAGVVMSRTEYFTGCRHYALLSRKPDKDGEIDKWQHIDEARLISTGKKVDIAPKGLIDPGGTFPNPPNC